MRRLRHLMAIACSVMSLPLWAATDIAGSSDPLGLPRVPHSTIVHYENDPQLQNRELVTGRVDKTRREIRLKGEIRTLASLQSATYEMPEDVRRQEVIDHYLTLLGDGEIFSCSGRDCGRSNDWANSIFNQALLYGPDRGQFYFAGEYGQAPTQLVAFYVIERGNKRIYAHLMVLTPDAPVSVEANANLPSQLSSEGFAIVQGVEPAVDGSLSSPALETLRQLTPSLQPFAGQQIYVVCHVYGPVAVDTLLESAGRCSETAASELSSQRGPQLQPFAAGPLLPGRGANVSRIELIMPHRLNHN